MLLLFPPHQFIVYVHTTIRIRKSYFITSKYFSTLRIAMHLMLPLALCKWVSNVWLSSSIGYHHILILYCIRTSPTKAQWLTKKGLVCEALLVWVMRVCCYHKVIYRPEYKYNAMNTWTLGQQNIKIKMTARTTYLHILRWSWWLQPTKSHRE